MFWLCNVLRKSRFYDLISNSVFYVERLISRRFLLFAFAGLAGFVIEIVIITIGHELLDLGPRWPRVLSFPLAFTATWWLNRRFTMKILTPPNMGEYFRYGASSSFAATVNLAVYLMLISTHPFFSNNPIIPLVIATLSALAINYTLMIVFVFRR
ncbi:MAG: GtrA family protein [Opitutales bacterium]|nr:GtrA family protein [Opitutales bacterium]